MKKITGLFLALLIAISVIVIPTTASAASATKKTVVQFKMIRDVLKKSEKDTYKCNVSGNNGNIKVKTESVSDYSGFYYSIEIEGLKATKTKKPVITITDAKTDKVIKKYEITVKAATKVKHANVKMNKSIWKNLTIKNPYHETKEQTLCYNKKILKFKTGYYGDGAKFTYTIKGIKKGTTTVKVKLKKTNFVVSKFKITVGDYKATVKKSYKKSTIKYNSHIKSYCLDNGGTLNIGKAVNNFHANSKYTVKIHNKKIAKTRKAEKLETTPEAVEIYSLKKGKTKVTVYEKRGKAKKKKIGTINLTVKKAKDSEVYASNRELDNDGIFYEFFVNVGDKIDLKKIVERRYLNVKSTGSHFKESEYKFTFKASPANVISVDKNGIYTIKDYGMNDVSYTITFKDGSKVSGGGSFDIVEDGE